MLQLGPLAGPAKTLVGQATRDNDSPPSGYQLDLLNRASFSSPVDCDNLVDAILRRLDSSSANVKWKTLRVISYLSQHGNQALRKGFQRKIDRLRACTGFTGPLHPLHGDAPNERVRIAAKDALAALFSIPDPHSHSSNARATALSGGGMGYDPEPAPDKNGMIGSALRTVMTTAASMVSNAAAASTSSISSYSGPKTSPHLGSQLTGMGNTDYQRPSFHIPSVLDKVKSVFDPNRRSDSQPHVQRSYADLHRPMGGGPAHRGDFDVKPARLDGAAPRQRGRVGGDWGGSDAEWALQPSLSPSRSSMPSNDVEDARQALSRVDVNETLGAWETRMIESLTSPFGISASPPQEELSTLLKSFRSMNQKVLLDLLAEKLEDGLAWQSQVKALSVIEALINEGLENIPEYFRNQSDNITKLTTSNLRAVRCSAEKVYNLLGLSTQEASSYRDDRTSTPTEAPDLLGAASPSLTMPPSFDISNPTPAMAPVLKDPLDFLLDEQTSSFPNADTPSAFSFLSSVSHSVVQGVEDLSTGPSSSPAQHDQGYAFMPPNQEAAVDTSGNRHVASSSHDNSLNPQLFSSLSLVDGRQPVESQPSLFESFSLHGHDRDATATGPIGTVLIQSEHIQEPRSAFAFVSAQKQEPVKISEKPIDPFASVIRAVHADTSRQSDSFSFVQDIMKDPT